jgi:phage repressor protein C with HTH and peptisase S24 domain
MEPNLSDGDYVVAATRLWRPRLNKMAVVRHQDFGILVKRIHRHSPGGYLLSSDNPLGTDSRTLGQVPKQQVIGPVLFSIRRAHGSKSITEKQSKAFSP